MPRHIAAVLLCLLGGCAEETVEDNRRQATSPNCLETDVVDIQTFEISPGDSAWDNDCDGYPAGRPDGTAFIRDCDDNNDTVYPTAPEFNNGVDANCDGERLSLYECGATGYAAIMLPPWLCILAHLRRRRDEVA